ncbi:PAS domain-containing protein [Parvularcula maris]|uniref:PAS domain-containing protein n=1 Tax=Parvularcula maris TaxID=2965077 RepID=A0A9X2L7V0_9PROT|nr:PAS domain-containing protein [Parvularcula maris]MCQ8184556.1 PAS domain-containing protein [Parvularcula maris]
MEEHFGFGEGGPTAETAQHLIAHMPLSMVIADPNRPDCPIVYVNRAFTEVTGYSPTFAVGRNCRFLQGENRDQKARETLRRAIENRRSCAVDIVNYRADGRKFYNRLMIGPVHDPRGEVFAFIGVQTELSDQQQISNVTAEEANAILQETQHRVKNHLSMVAAMIRFQEQDDDPVETYDILARQVESLSLLYDEFSAHEVDKKGSYDVVSAGAYISPVAATVGALDGRKSVRLNVDTEAVYMRTNDAAALGLLTSEILSNVLQHAFEDRPEGLVDVRLKSLTNGLLRLVVTDDGVGLRDKEWPA